MDIKEIPPERLKELIIYDVMHLNKVGICLKGFSYDIGISVVINFKSKNLSNAYQCLWLTFLVIFN